MVLRARGRTTTVLGAAAVALASMTAAGAVLAYDGGAGLYGCARADVDLARRLADDPALATLAERLDPGAEPDWSCDDDDSSIAAGLELATGLDRDAALQAGAAVLEDTGWVRVAGEPWTFQRRIDGHRIRSTLTFGDEVLTDPRADLSVSLGR